MMISAWMTTVFAFQQSDLLRSLEPETNRKM